MTESPVTIQVVDQIGGNKQTLELVVPSLQLTARELINLHVHDEYISHEFIRENASQMVKEIRRDLDGKSEKQFVWMDSPNKFSVNSTWETEAKKAQIAFQKGRFFIIIDNKQVVDLDTSIFLQPDSVVQFIRLVPLIGG